MRLVHSVGILIAELLDDGVDPVVVSECKAFAHGFLKTARLKTKSASAHRSTSALAREVFLLERSKLPAIVELVV